MPRIEYFLIANAASARVYAREGGREPLRLVREFEHPASRLKTAELGDDKAGRELSGRGFGGAAFEPKADAHRKERHRFALELCEFVEGQAQRGAFDSLLVFAPDPFLGGLKAGLGPAATRRLTLARDTDLSHVGPAELGKRIDKLVELQRHE